MAKKEKVEPTVTFLNEPPSGERIIEELARLYFEQEGFNVVDIKAEPSPIDKDILIVNDLDNKIRYYQERGGELICERL